MAKIHYCKSIEKNIIELSLSDTAALQEYYERGYLIILKDFKVNIDFDFISNIQIDDFNNKKKKYFLTLPRFYNLDKNRDVVWKFFKVNVFKNKFFNYFKFRRIVNEVNSKLYEVARKAFPLYRIQEYPITWKFHEVLGENMHIDNLEYTEKWPRLRVFCNVGTWHRIWGLSSHLEKYIERHLENGNLKELADSPFDFNMQLTRIEFGKSDDPALFQGGRHYIYFEPGEVWFLNSAVTAHQVLYGNRLVIGSFIHSYDDYLGESNKLTNIIKSFYRE